MDISDAAYKKATDVECELKALQESVLASIMERLDKVEQLARGVDLRTQIYVTKVTKWSPQELR